MTTSGKELFTTDEAAKYLSLAPISLIKLRAQGQRVNHLPPIPYVKLGARCIRYRHEDLVRYAQKHLINPAENCA